MHIDPLVMTKTNNQHKTNSKLASWILVLALVAFASSALAQNRGPRMARPTADHWSDGPTLLLKHKVATSRAKNPANAYVRTRARLRAMNWGKNKAAINVNDDMYNSLNGFGTQAGMVKELKAHKGQHKPTVHRRHGKLIKAAHTSRDRVAKLLKQHGVTGEQQNMLAEMMVWRGLAYNSSTLAHGSFGPKDTGNADLQLKAFNGLNAAIASSFKLGTRLQQAVKAKSKTFVSWKDITHLQSVAIKAFPEKEPGKVRTVNFTWPVNSFGTDKAALPGQVARFQKFLEPTNGKGYNRSKAFSKNPLRFMSTTLYWLHNVHAFRDGNGRTEQLMNWSMAKAAGFPLPLDYDQASGRFKLAATMWGGTQRDLQSFIAKGALGTERFARKLMPHLAGQKIVSNHTDHGAVGMVTAGKGQRNLMVMLPVTHARKMDSDLLSEQGKNRVVHTGSSFDPKKVTIQIAINGRHNNWQTIKPAAVNHWNNRYPWWKTVEPMFKVALPKGAQFVNFRVMGPDGKQISTADYYMNLQNYSNINSRIGS